MSSFSAEYLRETAAVVGAIDVEHLESLAAGLSRVREHGGRLFILGVGGSAGHASHAVNDFRKLCALRGLRADRQRLRADGSHQRRGLGHHVRGVARRVPSATPRTRCSSSRSAAASRDARCRPTSSTRSICPEVGGRSVFGIVGRDGGHTARLADACVVDPAAASGADHAAHRRDCARWSGTSSSRTPRCRCTRTKWESVEPAEPAVRRTTPSRAVIVGGAGFIGSHFIGRLLADAGGRAGHALRQLHLRPGVAPRASRTAIARLRSRARRRRRPRARSTAAMTGHDRRDPPRLQPGHRPAMTDPAIDFDEGTLLTHRRGRGHARHRRTTRILYASGSGVYGDLGETRGQRGPRPAACPCRPTARASSRARR